MLRRGHFTPSSPVGVPGSGGEGEKAVPLYVLGGKAA